MEKLYTVSKNHELTLIQIQHLRILLSPYISTSTHSENPSSQASHFFFFCLIIQYIQSSFRIIIPVLLTNRKAKKKNLWIHLVVSLSQTISHVLSCHLERLTWKGTDISSHQLPGAESAHGHVSEHGSRPCPSRAPR